MSATWKTCATLSTVSRPSIGHHRVVIKAGLSKPMLSRQLRPFLRQSLDFSFVCTDHAAADQGAAWQCPAQHISRRKA